MTFLPIVDRELRVATRRRVTYWSRVVAGIVAVALTAWMLQTTGRFVTPELVGQRLFRLVSELAFLCCLFPGVVLTADCLSEEKRDGTLGLLFLTDLKGYDVVFGKLAGTSLGAFYALLAIFPVLAIPLILGGVTPGEFWRMAAVLANTLLLSLATGLLVSAASWRAQRAMMGTACAMVAIVWFLPELGGWFRSLSPLTAFRAVFDVNYRPNPGAYFNSLLMGHGVSWMLLLMASWLAPRLWRHENSFRLPGIPAKLAKEMAGRTRPVLGDANPASWLATRDSQQVWIWGTLLLALAGWTLALVTKFGKSPFPGVAVCAAFTLHLGIQFWIAFEAARRFNEDRRSGALEMLLSTPLTVEEIVRGQIQSLTRQFARPIYGVFVLDAALIVLSAMNHDWSGGRFSGFLTVMLSSVGTLVVTSLALGWLGLWAGLKSRKTANGAVSTLVRIVVLPTGLFMFVVYVFFAVPCLRLKNNA